MSLVSIINKFRNLREYLRKGGIAKVERINVSQGELLKGHRVVITGGSSGIGLSIAKRFLDEGAMVVITGRSEKRLEDAKREINNDNLYTLVWDIGNTTIANIKVLECERVLDGCIDVFVNNAGIVKDQIISLMTEEQWGDVIDTNLNGCFYYMKAVSRKMIERHKGSIINVASFSGLRGIKGQGNYCASKAGIISLTKTLSLELAPKKVRVNAIAPGYINTDMIESLSKPVKDKFLKSIPLKRLGEVDDIVHLVKFLASDESSYITGQCISIDGGISV